MTKRERLHPVIAEMRERGLLYREIGDLLGISTQTAHDYHADPTGEKARARKMKNARPCVDCGKTVNLDGRKTNPAERCLACHNDNQTIWTRDAIVCAIQDWADERGGTPPSVGEFQSAKRNGADIPGISHVQYRFGTWDAAIIAAGFEPRASGPVGGFTPLTPEQRKECAQRYAAGESSVTIAADFGCSYLTVLRWVRRAGVPVRSSAFAA